MNQESPSQELVPLKKRRTRIPDKPNYSLNLWSIMKNCIGKELSKIPMPVSVFCRAYSVTSLMYRMFICCLSLLRSQPLSPPLLLSCKNKSVFSLTTKTRFKLVSCTYVTLCSHEMWVQHGFSPCLQF